MWKWALPFISEYAQESLGLSEPWGIQAKVFERRRSTPPFFLCFVFITSRRTVSRPAILRWLQVFRQIRGVWSHEMYCRHLIKSFLQGLGRRRLKFRLVCALLRFAFRAWRASLSWFFFSRFLNYLKCPWLKMKWPIIANCFMVY